MTQAWKDSKGNKRKDVKNRRSIHYRGYSWARQGLRNNLRSFFQQNIIIKKEKGIKKTKG